MAKHPRPDCTGQQGGHAPNDVGAELTTTHVPIASHPRLWLSPVQAVDGQPCIPKFELDLQAMGITMKHIGAAFVSHQPPYLFAPQACVTVYKTAGGPTVLETMNAAGLPLDDRRYLEAGAQAVFTARHAGGRTRRVTAANAPALRDAIAEARRKALAAEGKVTYETTYPYLAHLGINSMRTLQDYIRDLKRVADYDWPISY